MANVAPHDQRHMAHRGEYLRSWPPPGRLVAPAIMESRGGRHRKPAGKPDGRPESRPEAKFENMFENKFEGGVPPAIPPHPPLVSGGWYRSLGEVLGPGRYPVQSPVDKSVGIAVVLGVLLGPAGICYTSVTAGLIACGATAIALIVFGFVSLLVIWPLAIGAAVTSALMRHQWYQRK